MCVWNQSVYYSSHSVFILSHSHSHFSVRSICDCAYVRVFFIVFIFLRKQKKLTHWCCNGKEMHNKDRPYTAIKIVHHQFKINKRKEDEKNGNRIFGNTRERERERVQAKERMGEEYTTHTHSWTILNGWRKIVYIPSHFVFSSLHHHHHRHLTEMSNITHSTQPNRKDPSIMVMLCKPANESFTFQAAREWSKWSTNESPKRPQHQRDAIENEWSEKDEAKRKNDDNNKENVF